MICSFTFSGVEASESLTVTVLVNALGRVIIVERRLRGESPAVEVAIVGEEENVRADGHLVLQPITTATMGELTGQRIGLVTIAIMVRSYLPVRQGVENAIVGEAESAFRLLGNAPSATLSTPGANEGAWDAWLGSQRRNKSLNRQVVLLPQNHCRP